MKNILRLALVFVAVSIGQFIVAAPASATCGTGLGTCYGIAAGNFNNTTTVWSATSAGIACTCAPANGDNIILNASSGSGTYTINAAGYSFGSLDASTFTGTLVQTSEAVSISGNDAAAPLGTALVLPGGSGSTYTTNSTGIFTMTSTSGTASVKSNGKLLGGLVINGAAGTFQFADGPSVTATPTVSILIVTAGTLNFNGNNVTAAHFQSTNSNTRAINMGSQTLTLTGNDANTNTFDLGTATGLTLTASSSTIVFTDATNAGITMRINSTAGGPLTLGTVSVPADTAGRAFIIATVTGANAATITTLVLNAPTNVALNQNQLLNIGTLSQVGESPTAWTSLQAVATGAGFGNTVAFTTNQTMSYMVIRFLAFNGGGNVTAMNSIDLGGNSISGIGVLSITLPSSSGGGGHIIGGSVLKRDLNPASNDSTPAWLSEAA